MLRPALYSISLSMLLAFMPIHAFAQHGGGAGATGGGHADQGPLMSAEEISLIAGEIQKPVAAFYKYVSVALYNTDEGYLGTMGGDHKALGAKLFAGPHEDAILRKIYSVKPTVLAKGPCFDDDNNPVEASGLKNPDRICFSVERLLERKDLREFSGRSIILALAAHEYSHLLGSGEAEAEYIQKEIALKDVSNQSFDLVKYDSPVTELKIERSAEDIAGLLTEIRNRSALPDLCSSIGMDIVNATNMLMQTFERRVGVSYLSRYEFNQMLPALYRGTNYMMICKRGPVADAWRQKTFGSLKQISVWDYVMAQGSDPHGTIRVPGVVNRIEYGDYSTLDTEVTELFRELTLIVNAWPKNLRQSN